jgi:hypothetical protein
MSKKVYEALVRGLEEVQAYIEGEREGFRVTLPGEIKARMEVQRNQHIGSSVEDFLREDGILEEATAIAIKEVETRKRKRKHNG